MNDVPLAPWSVETSRIVHSDRWITLRADACRTADGHAIAPYYVLDYPDWVQVVAIDDADRIVMVEQYRHGLGVVSLEPPGGVVDATDADPIATARRELREETGCTADDFRLVASLAANPANQSNRCHIVLARGTRPVAAPVDDPTERIRVLWLPVDEVVRRALAGEVTQAAHVAALAMTLGPIGRWR